MKRPCLRTDHHHPHSPSTPTPPPLSVLLLVQGKENIVILDKNMYRRPVMALVGVVL